MEPLKPQDTINTSLREEGAKPTPYPPAFEPEKKETGAGGVGDRIHVKEEDPYHAPEADSEIGKVIGRIPRQTT